MPTLRVTIGERSARVNVGPDRTTVDDAAVTVQSHPKGELTIAFDGETQTVFATRSGDTVWVFVNGVTYEATVEREGNGRRRASQHQGSLVAPMPATVIAVNVRAGDSVASGQILVVLEAMKMELPVRAPADSIVVAVHCEAGQLVQPNVSLVDLSPRPHATTNGTGGGE